MQNLRLGFEVTGADGPTLALSESGSGVQSGVLLALHRLEHQAAEQPQIQFILAIEEPEAFLHPGAIQVMLDSFRESSNIRQVLVTTHSPELLDDREIPADRILAVQKDQMGSHVTPLESATKSIIQDRLYTPGQLLRQGGLF